MGSLSSKEKLIEPPLPPSHSNQPVLYKNSIYGWGRLKHPVKPSNGRISKKKKKGPAPSKDTKKIQHPTPFANPKPVKDASNVKYEPKSPKAEKVPLPESRPILQPERLMPNAQPILPDALEMRDPEPEPSKMAAKTNNSHNLDLPNIFPAERRDEGSMNNGGGFYGQYRCGKCGKYWRSSFARENVPQNCSRCKTPTLPRR